MSIFDLNGPKKIVANEEIQITEENRYFFPGIIHGGGKYVIQAYGWDVGDRPEDKRVEVKYLYAEDIVELAKRYTWKEGYLNEEGFKEGFKVLEEEAESFLVENDGEGGYYTLNQMWEKAESEDYEKLTKWALKACTKLFGASIYVDLTGHEVKFQFEEIPVVDVSIAGRGCSSVIYVEHPMFISQDCSTTIFKKDYLDKVLNITNKLSVFYSSSEEMCKNWLKSSKAHLEEVTKETYELFKKTYVLAKNTAILDKHGNIMVLDTSSTDKKPSDAELNALVWKVNDRVQKIEDCAVPDKVLAEMVRNNDFSYPGFADDILRIYEQSQDKATFRYLFFEFTGKEFEEYLQKCIREMEE